MSKEDSPLNAVDERDELQNQLDSFLRDLSHDRLRAELQNTAIPRLLNNDYIDQIAQKYNGVSDKIYELNSELQALEEAQVDTFYDLYTNDDGKFRSELLADDIRQDYDIITLRDSKQTLIYKDGYWKANANTYIKEITKSRLPKTETLNSRVESTVESLQSNYVDRDKFQPPKTKINIANGTYDVEKEELESHKPEHNFQHKIPYRYEEDAECPEFDSFLDEVLDRQEHKKTIYEFIGYTLLPDNPKAKALMLSGPGGNGKTVLIDVIKELIANDNYTNKALQDFNRSFDAHHIYGTLAVINDDLSAKTVSADAASQFKQITGGSDIGAEVKFGDHYDFEVTSKFVFAANQVPPTDDESTGFFRRWIIINFPYSFDKDPVEDDEYSKQREDRQELLNKLTTEGEMRGILRKSIAGVTRMFDRNEFTFEPAPEDVKEMWMEQSTPVVSFIKRFVEQGRTKGDDISQQQRRGNDEDHVDWSDINFDYITKDSFVKMVSAWSKDRGEGRVSKKKITQTLNKDFDFAFNSNTRTRNEPGSGQTRVYSGLKIILDRTDDSIPNYLFKLADSDSKESVVFVEDDDKALSTRVTEYVQNHYMQEATQFEELQQELVAEGVVTESEVDQVEPVIDNLLDEGVLYEPRSGKLQVL